MRTKKILGLLGVLLVVTVGVLAYVKPGQTKMITVTAANFEQQQQSAAIADDAAAKEAEAAAEKEIRQILEKYYEIARAGDREALKNFSLEISADGYRYSSELGVKDKQATLRHLDAIDLKFVNADFHDLTIRVYGADTAIAKYRDVSTVKMNGLLMSKPTRYTNVWVKQDGAWKIAAEHSSLAAPPELLPRNRFADDLALRK